MIGVLFIIKIGTPEIIRRRTFKHCVSVAILNYINQKGQGYVIYKKEVLNES